MFNKIAIIICIILCSYTVLAEEKVKKLDWDGIEVVWLEDNRFPTYNIMIYFGDGAVTDHPSRVGETNWMFSLLSSGTRRFSRKEIKDNLDYFGASYSGSAFPEYSLYGVSGLIKDVMPTMKKVCHMFDDANFPKRELKKLKKRAINSRKNIVTSHGTIAKSSFRELSMAGTPFAVSSVGKLKHIKKIQRKHLLNRLDHFNEKVFKRIYLTGPKEILSVKNIMLKECGWTGRGMNKVVKTSLPVKINQERAKVYLVTVPKANQAQIMLGRYTTPAELKSDVSNYIASGIVAGSPLGLLREELRNKRGLTYTASSYISMQRDYGRLAISTSTKSESVVEAIEATQQVLNNISKGTYPKKKFEMIKTSVAGSYPFSLESNYSYLKRLLFMDHLERPYSEFHSYPARALKVQAKEMENTVDKAFSWDQLTIVVVGEKKLAKQLKKLGAVEVVSYKKFL